MARTGPVLLGLTALLLLGSATPASGAVTCSRNTVTMTLTVTLGAVNDNGRVVRAGSNIEVHSGASTIACTNGPTLDNTSLIVFNDISGGNTTATVDLSGGSLEPGFDPDLFDSEIKIQAPLGSGTFDKVTVIGGAGVDKWLFGNNGATDGGDLNAATEIVGQDDDLVWSGVETLSLFSGNGADEIDAGGWFGPFTNDLVTEIDAVLGAADDKFVGGAGNDDVIDGGGNDNVDGAGGGDILRQVAGSGDDTLTGGSSSIDVVTYQDVDDPLRVDLGITSAQQTGGGGNDTLTGLENLTAGQGNDVLIGTDGGNQLGGQGGDDLMIPRGGNDVVFGLGGVDTVSYETPPAGATQGITLDLRIQPANQGLQGDPQNTGGAGTERISGVENLTGSPFPDTLIGNDEPNVLTGLGGTDDLSAFGGADALAIRDGASDVAACGVGADTVTADLAGTDTIAADCETVAFDVRPETTISAGPAPLSRNKTPTFAFSSSKAGSSFECSIDNGPFAACTSPRALGPVSDGAHTFTVRARDVLGNLDLSPAARAFSVDTIRPALDSVKIAKRFRATRKATPVSARIPRGSAFRYRLSEAATVRIAIQRCTKLRRKKCTRYKAVKTLTRKGKPGANRNAFTGRIGKKKLRAGLYRATLTATDAAGNATATTRRAAFTILP